MENETAQVRILALFFFFFLLLLLLPLFVCGTVTKGLFILLHIVAKSPAFPKKKRTNIRRGEQKILNKCNKFG